MRVAEYVEHDAVGLARLLEERQVSVAELHAAAREAIGSVNASVNGLVGPLLDRHVDFDQDGFFAGVPFLLKDAGAPVAGVPYGICSRLLEGYVPRDDSELGRRFKRAGLAIMGRTATPEFTLHWNTTSVVNGPTRNPWDLERVAGGSSGGAAALVAAGGVPMAHGNDAAGSIRMPAACCGAVGFKPTRGRVPMEQSVIGDELNVDFAVTRTVRDAAALLDLLEGPARASRYETAPPDRPFLEDLEGEVRPLRVGFLDTSASGEASLACAMAVEEVARFLERNGHHVSAAALPAPPDEVGRYPLTDISTYLAAWVDRVAELHGVTPSSDNLESVIWATYQLGEKTPAVELRRSWADRLAAIASVREFFGSYDLYVSPVVADEAPLLNEAVTLNDDVDDAAEWFGRMTTYMPFTPIFNGAGNPAVSLPIATAKDGLPIGVQLVAPFGDDALLFRLARQLEVEYEWQQRTPRVWAGAVQNETAQSADTAPVEQNSGTVVPSV
jgi:amidase